MSGPQWGSFTATPIFSQAALRFPQSGSIGEIEIPMHITKLTAQDEGSQLVEITAGVMIDTTSNLGSGGAAVAYGANQLSKVIMEGYIDTPVTVSGTPPTTALPGIVIDGNHVTYAEIIAAYFEGRTSTNSLGVWQMTFPRWFRDPYGRVYGDQTPTGKKGFIRIYDYTAQRVEAVPGRNNFTMTLQVV